MPDEYSYYTMCETLYQLLLEYFDSAKSQQNSQEIELNACKYAITFLIPATKSRIVKCDIEYQPQYYKLYEKCTAFAGRRSLEHFITYMEFNKPKPTLPTRICVLKPFIFYLNKLMFDKELEYVIASYPPSTGKSFACNYFSAWVFGLSINNSILRISFSDDLVQGFSRTIREIVASKEFSDVFPEYKKYGGNPFSTKVIDNWKLKDSDVIYSHMAMSRDGQIIGKRANKAIILDDIIKGGAEANDSATLGKYYNLWNSDWEGRKDGDNTKYVIIGTMWSPEDPINRIVEDRERISELEPSKKYKYVWESKDKSTVIIKVPMLDENDETTCEAVMTTKKAREKRDSIDAFTWACEFQQEPIPAEGLDFADDLLNHYDRLPINEDGTPAYSNYSLAVIDTTRKGKDNVGMPICKTDGKNYYMIDCIFKKKAMTELYEEIVAKIEEHNITWLVIENNTDTSLKTLLEKMLEERGIYYCNITEKYNTVKKEKRIKDNQGTLRKLIYFKKKSDYKTNSDYGRFMKNLTTYSFDYPNRNDDAPDSATLFVTEIILERGKPNKPKPLNRYRLGV